MISNEAASKVSQWMDGVTDEYITQTVLGKYITLTVLENNSV